MRVRASFYRRNERPQQMGATKKVQKKTSMISITYKVYSFFFAYHPCHTCHTAIDCLCGKGNTPETNQTRSFKSRIRQWVQTRISGGLQGQSIPRRKPGTRTRPPMTTKGRTLSPAESHKRSQATTRARNPATVGAQVSDSGSEGRSVVNGHADSNRPSRIGEESTHVHR